MFGILCLCVYVLRTCTCACVYMYYVHVHVLVCICTTYVYMCLCVYVLRMCTCACVYMYYVHVHVLVCICTTYVHMCIYPIHGFLVAILIWWFGKSHKERQNKYTPLTSHLYCKHGFLSIQYLFAIPPIVLFERIAKYI